ncbi:hypothetical protein H0H93_005635 [Arthromyces matolae]|nr:hypothetical protein H0H93_005635 [Arthromyces matolae]
MLKTRHHMNEVPQAAGQSCTTQSPFLFLAQRHPLPAPNMKISINVSFLILSLFALSAAASPILKLDDAVTTELSNSSLDLESLGMHSASSLQDMAERDILSRRQLNENRAAKLIGDVDKTLLNPSATDLETFSSHINDLAERLQLTVDKKRSLSEPVAVSLQEALHRWRAAISQLRDAKKIDVTLILVNIATCRNFVENQLAPQSSLISDISAALRSLEDNLRPRNLRLDPMSELNQLKDLANKWKKTRDIIHPKLMIYSDWVEGWKDLDIKKHILIELKKISDVWQENM